MNHKKTYWILPFTYVGAKAWNFLFLNSKDEAKRKLKSMSNKTCIVAEPVKLVCNLPPVKS